MSLPPSDIPDVVSEFHSWDYRRLDKDRLEIWMPNRCGVCAAPISLNHLVISLPASRDHLLGRMVQNHTPPPNGFRPHTAMPALCAACYAAWLDPTKQGNFSYG